MNAPAHYCRLSPEPLDVIEAWNLPFHHAQVLKYLARAGHKDCELTDLKKARYYLDRAIRRLDASTIPGESSQDVEGAVASGAAVAGGPDEAG